MANEFLPFAGAAGANVIAQSSYSTLPARASGFISGVAKSTELNKVWRQSSIMASLLGQFISDISGQDAVDDGTITALLLNFKSSVRAQSIGVVGNCRNLLCSMSAPGSVANFTADEIIVETSLGGLSYRLPSFNKTLNIATVGAGGMDVGSAPGAGYVAVYAIYNPITGASALLAINATSSKAPEVYGGGNMPAGYTASALLSVWPTSSGVLISGLQQDRSFSRVLVQAATSTSPVSPGTPLSVSTIIPPNARNVSGLLSIQAVNANTNIYSMSSLVGQQQVNVSVPSVQTQVVSSFNKCPVTTSQVVYWGVVEQTTLTRAIIYIGSYDI